MNNFDRRVFVLRLIASGSAVFSVLPAQAADPILSETEPLARERGYAADSSKVDNMKYPQHNAKVPQDCGGCQLYESIAGSEEPYGRCPLFEGKRVALKGWCASWV